MEKIREHIIDTIVEASEGVLSRELVAGVEDDLSILGLNSLTVIKLLVLLEEKFDMEFDLETVVLKDPILWSYDKLIEYIGNK